MLHGLKHVFLKGQFASNIIADGVKQIQYVVMRSLGVLRQDLQWEKHTWELGLFENTCAKAEGSVSKERSWGAIMSQDARRGGCCGFRHRIVVCSDIRSLMDLKIYS